MSSSNCYSSLYPFPFDLNEDDQHQQQNLFALKSQPSSSSSSCSLTCPTFFNPSVQNQAGSFTEPHEFQDQQDQAKICVPQDGQLGSGGDHHHEDSSYKWMPSKMRILRKMMSSERSDLSKSSTETKIEDLKVQINHLSSSPDNSSNPSYNNNNTTNCPIRVCSDCNTTKTPLWRSGPRGPKSLCNACGIRQRKARRAMAAAAAAAASNGTDVQAETTTGTKSKVQNKAKRSSNNCVAKLKNSKKYRLNSQSQGRKKLCFEDLRVILSQNSAFHRVFPQDEKEAAILLMALSYGLVHG